MAKDSADLQALFDSISDETLARMGALPTVAGSLPKASPESIQSVAKAEAEPSDEIYQRIGALTRQLNNALRELGYDRKVESAANSIPDTRQRLHYIATLTGGAAERTLANVEKIQSIQDKVSANLIELNSSWNKLFACELSVDEFKVIAQKTLLFTEEAQVQVSDSQSLLTDIMMAQDFHDLTGQVIQKVLKIAQEIEDALLKLLVDNVPPEKRGQVPDSLEGPVVSPEGRDDVVTSQAQVDDLLESLGF